MVKGTINILLWLVIFAGFIFLLGFTSSKQNLQTCTDVLIHIDNNTGNHFITVEDVRAMISHEIDSGSGKAMASINSEKMEYQLGNHPSIAKAEVYKTINGTLMVDISQRKPIVRIFTSAGESFYMDENGRLMPISDNFTARVMVANGYINESYSKSYHMDAKEILKNDSIAAKSLLDDIFLFANYIQKDPFWKAQIEQLYVNKEMEIELIPRVGNHTIVFGDASRLNEKFNNLMIFYNQGLDKTGWNEYSTINLKFKDQIICTKI